MSKPERVPGSGWKVGGKLFTGRLARAKAYKYADSKPSKKSAPAPKKESGAEWTLKTSPEDYLDKYPDGPNADLARQVLGLEG